MGGALEYGIYNLNYTFSLFSLGINSFIGVGDTQIYSCCRMKKMLSLAANLVAQIWTSRTNDNF